jgi:Predicted transcriptional regulators
MPIGELAHLLGVRTSTLRVWENAGLLAPRRLPVGQHRGYDADDVRDARVIRLLRQGQYRFTHIKPVIEDSAAAEPATPSVPPSKNDTRPSPCEHEPCSTAQHYSTNTSSRTSTTRGLKDRLLACRRCATRRHSSRRCLSAWFPTDT